MRRVEAAALAGVLGVACVFAASQGAGIFGHSPGAAGDGGSGGGGLGDGGGGGVAGVYYAGERVAGLPLAVDGEFAFEQGGGYNLVRVRDGEVFVAEANCANQYCVMMGAHGRDGERIVCLPNRLVVKVEGGAAALVDGVAE